MTNTEEKIRIGVSAEVERILRSDALAFGFTKKNDDTVVILNPLLNHLVENYFNEFNDREEKTIGDILAVLKKQGVSGSNSELNDIAAAIEIDLSESNKFFGEEKYDHIISFKPSRISASTVASINATKLTHSTAASYFRRLFSAYASLPRYRRERIIFKDNFDAIKRSIDEKKKVLVLTSKKDKDGKEKTNPATLSCYKIQTNVEQNYNYILVAEESRVFPLSLRRIVAVRVLNESASFTPKQLKNLQKREKYDPQYNANPDKETTVKIELSPHGQYLFQHLYVYRPEPDYIEGDKKQIYVFNNPWSQLIQYFSRFGSAATVIEPYEFYKQMRSFYLKAYNHYEKDLKKWEKKEGKDD